MDSSSSDQSLKHRFDTLDTAHWETSRRAAQQRGLLFEDLVQDLFEAEGMLIRRSYHTQDNQSEQIDGAIRIGTHPALLESKWVKAALAASDLFAFLGKVEGKFLGTIGVFVSRTQLSENFIAALRSGRRQAIIVIHGDDVDAVFRPGFPLKDYLRAHLQHLAIDNASHLSAKEFLAAHQVEEEPSEPPINSVRVKKYLKRCVEEESAGNLVGEFAEELSDAEVVTAAQEILKRYEAVVKAKDALKKSWKGQNLDAFLSELLKRFPTQETDVDREFFLTFLSTDFQNSAYGVLAERFADRFDILAQAEVAKVEKRLLTQWEKNLGDYDAENRLAIPTGHLWEHLSETTRTKLIPSFVDIVLSQRMSRYPQHRLAVRVLHEAAGRTAEARAVAEAFKATVRETVRSWFDAGWTDEAGRKKVEGFLQEANKAMRPYVKNFERKIHDIVEEEGSQRA